MAVTTTPPFMRGSPKAGRQPGRRMVWYLSVTRRRRERFSLGVIRLSAVQ